MLFNPGMGSGRRDAASRLTQSGHGARCSVSADASPARTLAPIIDYLKRLKNLWPIGRYGSFKYNNQDHSILMGLLVAENICSGANHDLWSVNTDYDSYQEAAATDPLLAAGSVPQPRDRRASARAPQ